MTNDAKPLPEALGHWQKTLGELASLEQELVAAMYAASVGNESPRHLIIEFERLRREVDELFMHAIEAVDAQSTIKTGMTDFGTLR